MTDHSGHRARKRRQFRDHGIDAFADHEVLELLLYYAVPRRDTNPIAHALMDRFGSLNAVLSAPVEELERVPGMGAQCRPAFEAGAPGLPPGPGPPSPKTR